MGRTIEQKVAEAILQKDIASIEIAGETFEVAPPSIATLILISEIISTLPVVEKIKGNDPAAIVSSVLHNAKDFRKLGNIAAILILGAKASFEKKEVTVTKRWLFGLIKTRKKQYIHATTIDRLAELILYNVRPSVLWQLIIKRLNAHEIGDFFLITTSLSEANLLKPTKEVD